MRVGLYGGSFDPAHAGHLHVARTALKRLGLDRVVWLVSPGNPLKSTAPADLARRMASARALAREPRMTVSDAETRLGVRYTIDTVRALKARYPGVRFVWIMGADSLLGFHRWRGWTELSTRSPSPSSPGRDRPSPAAWPPPPGASPTPACPPARRDAWPWPLRRPGSSSMRPGASPPPPPCDHGLASGAIDPP